MKSIKTILFIIFFIFSNKAALSQDRMIEVPGNKPEWTLVGVVPANTAFQIQAKGSVDFGCRLGACKDGVNAGVTGNSFSRAFRSEVGTIEKLFKDIAKDIGFGPEPFNEKVVMRPGEDLSSFIKRKNINQFLESPDLLFKGYTQKVGNEVNYDEGGFWVLMTTTNQAPVFNRNNFCQPALFYWYNELYKQLLKENFAPTLRFSQTVWVWVLPHDGGRNAFDFRFQDFHDNNGSYKVWIQ